MRESSLPRIRTVIILGCVVLVCTFYWDIIIMRHIYGTRPSSISHTQSERRNVATNWSWECAGEDDKSKHCLRVPANHRSPPVSLSTCTMTCQPGFHLWPYPTGNVKIRNTSSSFGPYQVTVDFTPVNSLELSLLLKKTTKLYQQRISRVALDHTGRNDSKLSVSIKIKKTSKYVKYKLNIDESYKLLVKRKGTVIQSTIQASTFLGARHGLESLMQLIWWDELKKCLKILSNVEITDAPIFTFRGLMLDTSRNFLPVPLILRTVEAMSMNKMNVFHWHLTGSGSFPFASQSYPKFAKFGPYSEGEIYTPNDIKQVVEHAETRGVTVLVEVDAPAHTSQGWNWGEEDGMGNLSLCLNAQTSSEFCSEPPCGQLNPVNNDSYSVLINLLRELYGITRTEDLIHVGGDDVDPMCWETNADVTDTEDYMKKGVMGIWEMFYKTLLGEISREKVLAKNIVIWSNSLLDDTEFWRGTKLIVQSRGPRFSGELEKLVKQKMRVIVSSSDVWTLGNPQSWTTAYHHQPWMDLSISDRRLVIGGEALAWTNNLDQHSLEPSLWPTAATVAERLWTDPTYTSTLTDRLAHVTMRLRAQGIMSSPVGPKWCFQNPSQCL